MQAAVAAVLPVAALVAGALLPGLAEAADLGTYGGFDVRLDDTVRLSAGLRLDGQDAAILANRNGDDGDRAFRPGLISERVDFASVLDITRGDFGAELGTDGWYDAAYHQASANHSAATFNPVSVPASRFPADTSRLLGGTIELGTAFVSDRVELAGLPVTLRLGRQSLLWGESLFFPQDGIAAAQAPVDEIKALYQPLVQNGELFLPVTQAVLRADLAHGLSLQAYEQLEWRRDRMPGVASYFSASDVGDVGGQRVFLPGGAALSRAADAVPGGFGQYGVALRLASDVVDLGLYAQRYGSKTGFVQTEDHAYHLVFPRGIQSYGASASFYVGDANVAGELSVRQHMPLVSTGFPDALGGAALPSCPPAGPCQAAALRPITYATGQTWQGLLSLVDQLPPGRLWQSAQLDAELSATGLLGVERNGADRLAGTGRLASAFEIVFVPQYVRVLPELNIQVPIGLEWGLSGRSSVDPGQVARVGNATLSLAATYATEWQFRVSYTRFLGPATQQPLIDRSFVAVSVSRTF